MKVIVPVKRVPDTAGEKKIDPNDKTVDRDSVESVLCPVNEFAIEEAVRLKENQGAEVKVLLVGPDSAQRSSAVVVSAHVREHPMVAHRLRRCAR